ncbi:zinc finger, CCHC-type containing protein [Tanacetum coccineum]
MAAIMKHMAANFSKLDKFEGMDFSRWQKHMHFFLLSINVVYVLSTPILNNGDDVTMEQMRKRSKWKNDDYVCKSLILNGQLFFVIEPNESVLINSIIESRDAIFDENRFSSIHRPSQRSLINGTNDDEVLADLPPGCKWIFKRKLKVDGTIEKFKDRLVIQCFRQKSKINYFDTYAPVAHINTIRLLIALTSIHNLIIHQIDVKTTFLNGEMDEKAPKKWHQQFDEVDLTKEFLSSRFSMKDMGEADVFLVSTPMDTSEKMRPNNGQAVSQLEYSRVSGCLMYVMTCTKPDIPFIVAYKKQSCITSSTMKSEFVALTATGKEVEWLKNLLLEILLWSKLITPISIHCDSVVTLAKA